MTLLDGFKINLGLPTEVEVRIDDSPLDQFELNDERLDAMRTRTEALLLRLVQSDELPDRRADRRGPPAPENVRRARRRFTTRSSRESQRWQKKLDADRKQGFEGPEGAHRKEIFDRERVLLGQAEADARRDQRRHR